MSEYTTLAIRHETRPFFEQAKEAVKEERGDDVTTDDVIKELAKTYQRQKATDGGRRYGGQIREGD